MENDTSTLNPTFDYQYGHGMNVEEQLSTDDMKVPCPTCGRRGFVDPPFNAPYTTSNSSGDVCQTCNGDGWIIVNKYKYLERSFK